jgi:hypothetical protein
MGIPQNNGTKHDKISTKNINNTAGQTMFFMIFAVFFAIALHKEKPITLTCPSLK